MAACCETASCPVRELSSYQLSSSPIVSCTVPRRPSPPSMTLSLSCRYRQGSHLASGFFLSSCIGARKSHFPWRVHWNFVHWSLFSVNAFTANKVKIVECYTPYRSVSGCSSPFLRPFSLWRSAGTKPDLRLPSQCTALPLSLDQYLFPFPLRVGGWVNLSGWFHAEVVYG